MPEWREQIKNLWERFDQRQRWIIIGSAVFLFVAVLGTSYWVGSKPDYVPLFTAMETRDAGEVAARLQEMKVPFEITGNGTAITVPSKEVYRTRLELARQGLPRGSKGFEIFDESKFGTTEFQNKIKYLQALQGELTRTIEQMAEVDKARVHIVMPEDSLYKRNEKPATASIMIKLKSGAQLSKEQVRGIVNLAAHSVRGLKAENITVVDHLARVLNDGIESVGSSNGINVTQVELTRKKQDEMQKTVESLLEQVLGPNKAAVRVNLELSFDQRTVDKQTFEPVVDDKGILRSTQESSESFKGSTAPSSGPPGTTSNIPGYVTGNNSGGGSTFEKKDATRNYEVNETKEKIVVAPGGIKRISVAVLVDSSVNRNQMDSITKTVASAVGINPARGDSLSVENIPFSTEVAERSKKEEEQFAQDQQRAQWLKTGLGAAGVGLVLFMIYIVLKRRQEEEVEVLAESVSVGEAALAGIAEALPGDKHRSAQYEAIEKLAKSRPEEVAQLLKTWLVED